MQDHQQRQDQEQWADQQYWADWFRRADELSQRIVQERGGQPLDVDLVIQAAKEELETCHDHLFKS
jgi:hypothetical protein